MSTKPFQKGDNISNYVSSNGKIGGPYDFFCALDRCVPSESTAKIMNAADPTKISEDEEDWFLYQGSSSGFLPRKTIVILISES